MNKRVFIFSMLMVIALGLMVYATPLLASGTGSQPDTIGFPGLKNNLNTLIQLITDRAPGVGTPGLWDILADIVKIFLSFLGVIFLGLMLYAGFNWMTAMGDAEKVTKAKDTIIAATIGLVIIMGAYAIVTFVIPALVDMAVGSG